MKRAIMRTLFLAAITLSACVTLPPFVFAENATITGDGVRLREEASTDTPVVLTLNKGARVQVIVRSAVAQTINGDFAYWYWVESGDESGYVFGHFLAIDPAAAPSYEPFIDPKGPKLPYEERGVCPFECCAYKEWSVEKETVILSGRFDGAPAAFTVRPGEWVTGLTGDVVTAVPGRGEVKAPMMLGNRQAVPGDVVELFTYQGEGFYRAWFKGRMLESVEGYGDIVMTVEPTSTWWVQIRNKKGQTGWTDQTRNFGHMDGCAGD